MQLPQVIADELHSAALKSSPVAFIYGAAMVGWGPQDWAYVLTGVYLTLQCAYLIWKWRREAKKPDETDHAGP